MVLEDEQSPVILEVVSKDDIQDLDAHLESHINEPSFDGDTLTYRSVYGDTFTFDAAQSEPPTVNGEPVDYAPPFAFSGPFVQADWNSGKVWIGKDEREAILDFNHV